MPSLNKFFARIETTDPNSANKTEAIPEYGTQIEDQTTIRCFIPAQAGDFFRVYWGYKGPKKDAFAYSAEFLRDGEAVRHLAFSAHDAATLDGYAADCKDVRGETWYYRFRSFEATGEGAEATNVPGDIGTLKLIIRRPRHDVDHVDVNDAKKTDLTRKVKSKERRPSRNRETLVGNVIHHHNVYTEWADAKARQDRCVELAKYDGTVWKNGASHRVTALPMHAVEGRTLDVVAVFIFYYCSSEQVKAHVRRDIVSTPKLLKHKGWEYISTDESDSEADSRDSEERMRSQKRQCRRVNGIQTRRNARLTKGGTQALFPRDDEVCAPQLPVISKLEELDEAGIGLSLQAAGTLVHSSVKDALPLPRHALPKVKKEIEDIDLHISRLLAQRQVMADSVRSLGDVLEGDKENPIVLD